MQIPHPTGSHQQLLHLLSLSPFLCPPHHLFYLSLLLLYLPSLCHTCWERGWSLSLSSSSGPSEWKSLSRVLKKCRHFTSYSSFMETEEEAQGSTYDECYTTNKLYNLLSLMSQNFTDPSSWLVNTKWKWFVSEQVDEWVIRRGRGERGSILQLAHPDIRRSFLSCGIASKEPPSMGHTWERERERERVSETRKWKYFHKWKKTVVHTIKRLSRVEYFTPTAVNNLLYYLDIHSQYWHRKYTVDTDMLFLCQYWLCT